MKLKTLPGAISFCLAAGMFLMLLPGCVDPDMDYTPGPDGSRCPLAGDAPDGYNLFWADEFDANELDTVSWKYRIGASGTSYQRAENIEVEDGYLKILLKKESYNGMDYTGGGVITRFPVKYGYFEVSAKLDGGQGWHEAFWTSWLSGFDDDRPAADKIEIDCFEHYANYDEHTFTYGTIQWAPISGNVNRDYATVAEDLTTQFNTYGFEYSPDYLNYYFNGRLLRTVDMRQVPQHEQYLWLSCIANAPEATPEGTVYFDYVRCYDISSADYETRKVQFIDYLDSLREPLASEGTDLWVEAEDFLFPNFWTAERDDNTVVLKGFTSRDPSRDSTQLKATTGIEVAEASRYHLWVRARDYAATPGIRTFKVIVNGRITDRVFGDHGQEGFAWQYGGAFDLPQGVTVLDLFDSSQYFARCDKLLFTTDADFVPVGAGAFSNVTHTDDFLGGTPFGAGNIAVLRIGEGSSPLVQGNAYPVFIDEYTPSGVFVRSIAMPTSNVVTNRKLTLSASGTDFTEGFLSLSPDGQYLALAGYDAAPGYPSVITTPSSQINRVVGLINARGNVNTSTALNTFNTVTVRSAVTSNGRDIWTTGGNNGVRYAVAGSNTSIAVTSTTGRALGIFDGQLYATTTAAGFRMVEVGQGLPTTGGQEFTNLPGIVATSGNPFDFFMADLDPDVPGVDVLYIADDMNNALSKYSLVNGVWTLTGRIGNNVDKYRAITGRVVGNSVVLFATRGNDGLASGGEVVTLTDNSGYNGTLSGTPQVIVSAPSNTIFRGISIVPAN